MEISARTRNKTMIDFVLFIHQFNLFLINMWVMVMEVNLCKKGQQNKKTCNVYVKTVSAFSNDGTVRTHFLFLMITSAAFEITLSPSSELAGVHNFPHQRML